MSLKLESQALDHIIKKHCSLDVKLVLTNPLN